MKIYLKKSTIAILLIIIGAHSSLLAQFQLASVTEAAFGVTVNGRATGNDIIDISGSIWEVTVWEDPFYSSPELGFRFFPSGG